MQDIIVIAMFGSMLLIPLGWAVYFHIDAKRW